MTSHYSEVLFTPAVQTAQERQGSREFYADQTERPDVASAAADRLTEQVAQFIAARDSFYMATVGETGWPYIQHRGGPAGFVRILSENAIGFADFRGNRQYISVGNLANNNRVSLFFMDYINRARLKLIGRARLVDIDAEPVLISQLAVPGYRAAIERGVVIQVEAYDWNCPQHIRPRFSEADIEPGVRALHARIADLEARLAERGETPGEPAAGTRP